MYRYLQRVSNRKTFGRCAATWWLCRPCVTTRQISIYLVIHSRLPSKFERLCFQFMCFLKKKQKQKKLHYVWHFSLNLENNIEVTSSIKFHSSPLKLAWWFAVNPVLGGCSFFRSHVWTCLLPSSFTVASLRCYSVSLTTQHWHIRTSLVGIYAWSQVMRLWIGMEITFHSIDPIVWPISWICYWIPFHFVGLLITGTSLWTLVTIVLIFAVCLSLTNTHMYITLNTSCNHGGECQISMA